MGGDDMDIFCDPDKPGWVAVDDFGGDSGVGRVAGGGDEGVEDCRAGGGVRSEGVLKG